MEQLLDEAKEEAKSARKAARRDRRKELEDQLVITNASHIKNILKAERVSYAHRNIRSTKGVRTGAIPYLLVPTEDGLEYVQEAEELESFILDRNQQHFQQANNTPLADENLEHLLFDRANYTYSERWLQDDEWILKQTQIPQYATPWLLELRKPLVKDPIPALFDPISAEDFIKGWRKSREKTAPGKSGLHGGMYKTITRSERLTEYFRWHLSLPFLAGFTLDRWRTVIDYVLPKEDNNFRADKLRIIQLLELDLNFTLKTIWSRRIMSHLEADAVLNDGQFGFRRGRSCHQMIMQRLLSIDLATQRRLSISLLDVDAQAAFDRLIPYICILQNRRIGSSTNICKFLFKVLTEARHYVQTAFGISANFYEGSNKNPLNGSAQGSGSSSSLWTINFDVLLAFIESEIKRGVAIIDIDAAKAARYSLAMCFADDLTCCSMPEQPASLEDLKENMQIVGQKVNDALTLSGGKYPTKRAIGQRYVSSGINGPLKQ